MSFPGWRIITFVVFAFFSALAQAGNLPITYSSSDAIHVSSGTDYFGWSGQTISISSTISSMTPMSITNLSNGGVQDVYAAIINVTGFQPNLAGTMTLMWYPGTGGSDSVSIAMTYANFGLTTTVTETLDNLTMPNGSPAALMNAVLVSSFDKVTVTSNWGENATFTASGNLSSANDSTHIATAPEPAGFALLGLGLGCIGALTLRRASPRKC